MVRSFLDLPVDNDAVESLVRAAHSGPSAGNTRSLELLVLRGADANAYWDVTLPPERRATFPWPGMLIAPVLLVPYVRPDSYLERYSEDDKRGTGLGRSEGEWPVPFWWVDGGAAAQNVLLAANALGLGACLFGQFEHEDPVRRRFGVPSGFRAVCTMAIGHRDRENDRASRSAQRPRRALDDVTHYGRWGA